MDKLTQQQKQIIVDRIRTLDPSGEVVTLTPNANYSGGSIAYNTDNGIVSHEKINRLTDEEYVRAYLVVRLVRELRYPADCLELEKTYTIGRPSATKAQIDVKVWDKRGSKARTFMLIEAKRPDDFDSYTKLIEDQLFGIGKQESTNGVRYLAWYSIEFHGNEFRFRDKCIVIDFREHHDYREWVEAGEPGRNFDLPVEYGTVRKQRYVKGETPLRTDVTREELETLRRDFHNVLWGGAKMGDTDVFNNLLKMFLAKIYDEQWTERGKPYRFQIELKDGKPESSDEVLAKTNSLYQDALRYCFNYDAEKVLAAKINENRFPPNKVTYVVERLEDISIVENTYEDDVLGVFFESIVRTGFKQEKGQFFTHTNIVRFMLYALELDTWAIELINGNPPTLPFIIDPSCGSGTFLLEAMKLITQSVLHTNEPSLKSSFAVQRFVDEYFLPNAANKNAHNHWAQRFVYGIDDNEDLATATKVNMILHGDGNANIQKADGLADFEKYPMPQISVSKTNPNAPYKFPVNEQFDCIVSNPPFSLKEESRTLAEYGSRFAYAAQKNSENLFIERWYQLLKEGGRMGVVLPDSVFDTNENLYIRMFLYRFFYIRAVVSLPQVTFQPYTPTKTSLLFAVKKTRKEVDQWDAAWRKAANEYAKLRKSPVVEFVLQNERLRNALIDLAMKAEVEWYPSANVLTASTLSADVRKHLTDACADSPALSKRLNATLAELDESVSKDMLNNLSAAESESARETLKRLLRDRLPLNADALTLPQFVEAAYDDIVQAAELNYTEDPKGQNYCNAWWCFAEVTSQKPFDYEVFFAEAEHVGYKRTTRHPEGIPQPNDLFQTDENGNIVIDTENPKTILDVLRSKTVFFCDQPTVRRLNFSNIANHFALRGDAKYRLFWGLQGGDLFPDSLLPRYPLKHALLPLTAKKLKKGELDDEFTLVELEDVEQRTGIILDKHPVTEIQSDKLMFGRCDVLTTRLRPNLGKTILNNPDERLIGTTEWIPFKVNHELLSPVLLKYFLLSSRYVNNAHRLLSGKEHPRIAESDLVNLRVPLPERKVRERLVARIAEIESKITAAWTRLRQPADIINEILCEAFDYPLKEHQERERERQFTRRLSDFGAGFTLRSSVKFHHPDYELTDTFFDRAPHERVKAYLAVPIRLGVSLTRAVMDDDGEAYYVHPNALKRQERIDSNDCHRITLGYYEKNKRRGGLRVSDVLINRSGEGTIGKAALFDLDDPCLFSDFTMRLRFNDAMNPQFACYFFRSIMFQAQVEREKRGMGNMTNIFPSQVAELRIVAIDRKQQDALADQITSELNALQRERETIEARRREIDGLIEEALKED
jgi:type I restriction enzyme M protein